jgi:hypothetical protein
MRVDGLVIFLTPHSADQSMLLYQHTRYKVGSSFGLTEELSLELGHAHLGGTGYGIRVH